MKIGPRTESCPPAHQDSGDPDARAQLMQKQIAGDLEEEIPEEEDAGQKPELLAGDGQLLVHGEGGEADVDAVQKRDHVEDEQEGDDPRPHFADGPAFEVGGQVSRSISASGSTD